MGQVSITDVTYIVDENLLSLGNAMVAVRHDTARFSRPPVEELLPRGIADTEWIPIVGDRGWVMITNDRRLRTRPAEAELAIAHRLKVVHLHGKVGSQPAWDQLVRVATRWLSVTEIGVCKDSHQRQLKDQFYSWVTGGPGRT